MFSVSRARGAHVTPSNGQPAVITLGGRVRELIDEFHAGSLRKAARDLGIPVTTLFQVVGDQRQPRAETLRTIARYYMVSADWLLTGEGLGPVYASDARGAVALHERPWKTPASAGWLTWKFLLFDRIGLPPGVREDWNLVPVTPLVAAAGKSFGSSGRGKPNSAKAEIAAATHDALIAAVDSSCRAWHGYFSALVELFGVDAVRDYMVGQHDYARLGFNPLGLELALGDTTAAAAVLSRAAGNPGVLAPRTPNRSTKAAGGKRARSRRGR